MKRAKIMLMAIAVVGVVGGALAFKAKHFTGSTFYSYTVSAGKTGCLKPVTVLLTTTAPGSPGSFTTDYSIATNTTARAINQCTALVTSAASE